VGDLMYPGAPAPAHRPATITTSAYLLYAVAALSLIGSVITLTSIGTTSGVYKEAYAGTAQEGMETVFLFASVGAVVLNILFAAGLAVLAVFNNRGRQGARVTTWALGGVVLCCSGLGLATTAATSAFEQSATSGGGPSTQEIEDRLNAALPGWYGPTTTTLSVLMLVALLAALILLALPASNTYFRTIREMRKGGGWDPSMPYPMYPGQQLFPNQPYPGQPYPGQPYRGQPYPGQPYPGQPYPGQPASGQPYPGQPYPGQPASGQPDPGQPASGQPYPGQSYPGQSYPGQSYPGQPASGQQPPGFPAYPGQQPSDEPRTPPPASWPPTGSPEPGPGEPPRIGSIPASDPWDRPNGDDEPKPPPRDS
jgi:hypothetical protein